ncbi:uncharacterized protein V6R79_025449 [Siganus canaliculatus]
MTHFRGQIRGPHWGLTMDRMLIDFWRKHECLFNSTTESYHDKDLKTKLWREFGSSVGKTLYDVERRSRSLRTQYGRLLSHPERVNTPQKMMLKERMDFLRPFIVCRRSDSYVDEGSDDQEEDEESETAGSVEQKKESSFGSPLNTDVTGQEESVPSVLNPAPLHCANPQVAEVMSLKCPHPHRDPGFSDQAANTSQKDVLSQFAEVMLSDMRHIKDPLVVMRLRRDITDLVYKAVEEDKQRQSIQAASEPSGNFQSQSSSKPPQASSRTGYSWMVKFLEKRGKAREAERRMQRREEMKHMRRMSRRQAVQPAQDVLIQDGMTGSRSEAQASGAEMHKIKTEEDLVPLV